MNFEELKNLISTESAITASFDNSSQKIQAAVFSSSRKDFIEIVSEIGVIPEPIGHDSSEEKLFAKAADIVLARGLTEIGINSAVIRERSNCADVTGKSIVHGYTLVGDAKAFRLSRTAKNQKDFKVKSMVDWKQDNDYAVLVCPYFQYLPSNSAIYGQALDGNVCLFSWEQLQFLLENNIKEDKELSLAPVWNMSSVLQEEVLIANKNLRSNYSGRGIQIFCATANKSVQQWNESLAQSKQIIIDRGNLEIAFWKEKIEEIREYSRDKAISELLTALKLEAKITAIGNYIDSLQRRRLDGIQQDNQR